MTCIGRGDGGGSNHTVNTEIGCWSRRSERWVSGLGSCQPGALFGARITRWHGVAPPEAVTKIRADIVLSEFILRSMIVSHEGELRKDPPRDFETAGPLPPKGVRPQFGGRGGFGGGRGGFGGRPGGRG